MGHISPTHLEHRLKRRNTTSPTTRSPPLGDLSPPYEESDREEQSPLPERNEGVASTFEFTYISPPILNEKLSSRVDREETSL